MEFRHLLLETEPETAALVVFVSGPASEEQVQRQVLEPLLALAGQRRRRGRLTADQARSALPAPRVRQEGQLDAAVAGVLDGATALLLDGEPEALLVGTEAAAASGLQVFGPQLAHNLSMLRARLRDPALMAEALHLPPARAASATLLYVAGRADAGVVEGVRRRIHQKGGEGALQRGAAAGPRHWGLLPDLLSSPWPDTLATLLAEGYVAVLVDRLPHVYIAPVTLPAMLRGPGDSRLRRPVARILHFIRVLLGSFVLLGPALVVALKEYHQEMLPTPFLLGLASVRETAPLPVVAEVLGLELLQELIRLAAARPPLRMTPGQSVVNGLLLALAVILSGLVGPLVPIVSAVVALATLALPGDDVIYLVRAWRWPMIFAAALFGLYGMSAASLLFAIYLSQASSFGVPWAGETGVRFESPQRASSRRKGGRPVAPARSHR